MRNEQFRPDPYDGLTKPPDFRSMIGTLLPIAPCRHSSSGPQLLKTGHAPGNEGARWFCCGVPRGLHGGPGQTGTRLRALRIGTTSGQVLVCTKAMPMTVKVDEHIGTDCAGPAIQKFGRDERCAFDRKSITYPGAKPRLDVTVTGFASWHALPCNAWGEAVTAGRRAQCRQGLIHETRKVDHHRVGMQELCRAVGCGGQ